MCADVTSEKLSQLNRYEALDSKFHDILEHLSVVGLHHTRRFCVYHMPGNPRSEQRCPRTLESLYLCIQLGRQPVKRFSWLVAAILTPSAVVLSYILYFTLRSFHLNFQEAVKTFHNGIGSPSCRIIYLLAITRS